MLEKTVWVVSDEKRGHENQTQGLIAALSQHAKIKQVFISTQKNKASWFDYLFARLPKEIEARPHPDLIIGTGSQTHSTLLAAGRATQAPTVVIMAPPHGMCPLFSRCIIPQHDARQGKNIIQTLGAMNLVRPAAKKADSGLFLIGGPSKHHNWNELALVEQIQQILQANPAAQWTLTTSRRTPHATCKQLLKMASPQLQVIPAAATPANWLPSQLANTEKAWVTEDSVSMIYEALSGGVKVGILPVPRKTQKSRIIRGLDHLIQNHYVLPYCPKRLDLNQFKSSSVLAESERVADIIARIFFK